MLSGKTIILGVTGSIAAYKAANLASMLRKQHADVQVIMTKNATEFINPITFETLTGKKCLVDTFDRNFQYEVEHVELAKRADLAIVAPASANVIAKLAHGIADEMLTTTLLACTCPKLVAPAMNTRMQPESDHAGQSGDTAPLWLSGDRTGEWPSGLWRYGSRKVFRRNRFCWSIFWTRLPLRRI